MSETIIEARALKPRVVEQLRRPYRYWWKKFGFGGAPELELYPLPEFSPCIIRSSNEVYFGALDRLRILLSGHVGLRVYVQSDRGVNYANVMVTAGVAPPVPSKQREPRA